MKNSAHFKEFIKYSTLNILGMLGLSCYILADTFFVSRGLGSDGLTALNLAIPIYSFIHGSGLMLGMGGSIKYSVYKSQGHSKNADRIFTHTIFFGLILAFIFFLAGAFLSQPVTLLLGAGPEVFDMTNTYLKVILMFAPAFILNDILICFVRNDGSPQLSMTAMIGGSLLNILLDYIFIFPLNMGIFGAVFATGLAPLFSMLILSIHRLKHKNNFHLSKGRFEFKVLPSLLSLGFPSLIAEVSSGIVIIVFNIIILNLQGNVGVAAYGIIANLSLVVISIFTGIAQGIQPLISRLHGHNNPSQAKRVLAYALTEMIIISIIIYMIIFFCVNPLISIFNSGGSLQLQKIAAGGLKLYFTAIGFAGFNLIISTFFASLEMPVPAHIISLSRGLIVIVPMTFLLSSILGITGVWLSFPAAELLVATLSLIIYHRFVTACEP